MGTAVAHVGDIVICNDGEAPHHLSASDADHGSVRLYLPVPSGMRGRCRNQSDILIVL